MLQTVFYSVFHKFLNVSIEYNEPERWATKAKNPSHPWKIKIVMALLRVILRGELPDFGNSPLHIFTPMSKPTQPTKQPLSMPFFF